MNLSNYEKLVIEYFVFVTIKRMEEDKRFTGVPNIKFIFRDCDILILRNLINNCQKNGRYIINTNDIDSNTYLESDEVDEALTILKNNQVDYLKYRAGQLEIDNNTFFIKINKMDEFTRLLASILRLRKHNNPNEMEFDNDFITSFWLRMNVSDFKDVNSFLRRQLNFIQNGDSCLNDVKIFARDRFYPENYNLAFMIGLNENWFEANKYIVPALFNGQRIFEFPMIHYGISNEDGKKLCYIYGIQDNKDLVRDNSVENDLHEIKKSLRNKYVKYTFLLSLKYFIEILKANNIYNIKVPLLQVMNYPYHENLSMITEKVFPIKYSLNKKRIIEQAIEMGIETNLTNEYQSDLAWFNKFNGKADLISKNKTERLVETFMVLNEKFDLLEFMTDPFIEDENLNIKIKTKNL